MTFASALGEHSAHFKLRVIHTRDRALEPGLAVRTVDERNAKMMPRVSSHGEAGNGRDRSLRPPEPGGDRGRSSVGALGPASSVLPRAPGQQVQPCPVPLTRFTFEENGSRSFWPGEGPQVRITPQLSGHTDSRNPFGNPFVNEAFESEESSAGAQGFTCGEEGHMARDCEKGKGNGQSPIADLNALRYSKGKGGKG